MVVTLLPLTSSASAEYLETYNLYTVLGDSIPAGYGPYNYKYKGYEKISKSYPSLVADRVAKEFKPLARTGFRTVELRYMLEDDFEGDDYLFRIGKTSVDDVYRHRPEYREYIAKSDLITIQIGSNDIFNYGMVRAIDAMNNPAVTQKIKDYLEETGDYGQAFSLAIQLFGTAESLTGIVTGFVQGMYEGYYNFMKNWEAIMSDIYELAPNATVVVVGMYNPLKTTKLTDYSLITIGKAFEVITAGMNQFMKYGSRFSSRYKFVNASGTEIYTLPSLTNGMYMDMLLGMVHPTEAGHRDIANKILEALPIDAEPVGEPELFEMTPHYLDLENHTAYISGYSDGTFRPQNSATRAEFAAMLYALLDENTKASKETDDNSFTDIKGHWAIHQISTIANLGLMDGYSDGSFRPDRKVTRAEAVTVLTALYDDFAADVSSFTDMDNHWASTYVNKAVKCGITAGYADGTFRPEYPVTRAQLVTMINSTMGRKPDEKSIEYFVENFTFSDVDSEMWFYHNVIEASVSHQYIINKDVEMWTKIA